MRLENLSLGFALTGSHCTLNKVLPQMQKIVEKGGTVIPIISPTVGEVDTRFGEAAKWKQQIVEVTGKSIINSIAGAEPVGPKNLLDVLVIAPCTGNTIAKLANGITDSSVLMAAKAQLRNRRPVVIGVSTNDGLGLNAKNLAVLLNTKNIYMVPFRQDNPFDKNNSLVSDMELIIPTIQKAISGEQLQPILLGPASAEVRF